MQGHRLAVGIVGAALLASASIAGCSASKATELIPGFSTQVRVPRDLKTIRVEVNAGGALLFCRNYPVLEGGKVLLPRTLGLTPTASPGQAIGISILGFQEDVSDVSIGIFNDCGTPASVSDRNSKTYAAEKAATGGARVVRRLRQ